MAQDNAILFRQMAERIEKNDPEEFSGALLIVPPRDGKSVQYLAVNPEQDAAAFWGAVSAFVQRAMAEIEEQNSGGFGMRR